jgi:hypothetical protein
VNYRSQFSLFFLDNFKKTKSVTRCTPLKRGREGKWIGACARARADQRRGGGKTSETASAALANSAHRGGLAPPDFAG